MRKIIFQFLILCSVLIGIWYALNAIDWMRLMNIKKMTDKTEKKLGDLCWEAIKHDETELKYPELKLALDTLLVKICETNEFDRKEIKLHLLSNDDINAFALPDNHLVVYSGLITNADNESELAGVLCHEIAHMQSNHVAKKLINELGLTAVISVTNSGTGGEVIKKAVKSLTSSAYSRSLETEADEKGADYLINAGLDPVAFANFFKKIDSAQSINIPTWISSHPDSKERTIHIKDYIKNKKYNPQPILSPQTLPAIKKELIIGDE